MKRKAKIKKNIIVSLFIFIALSASFVSGFFSNDTVLEQSADYVSTVVKRQTENQTYCAIGVDSNEKSGSLPDPFSQFHQLYGIFKQTKATFGSIHNFQKKEKIFYDELGETSNLSMFYLGAIGIEKVDNVYRHYMYPFEVMFKESAHYDVSRYLAFISQSHADAILEKRGRTKTNGKYSEDDYRSIYSTLIPITINGVTSNFVIDNIFYERGYYYECINEISGDFFLTSYYLPVVVPRTNVYLLSGYSFQNSYFMKYINEVYSNKLYDLSIGKHNINGQIDDDRILNFYYGSLTNSLNYLSYIFVIFAFICFAIASLLLYKFRNVFSITNYVLFVSVLFVPYLIFKLVYLLTDDVVFFSTFGARLNLLLSICFLVIFPIVYYIDKRKIVRKKMDKTKYEEFYI